MIRGVTIQGSKRSNGAREQRYGGVKGVTIHCSNDKGSNDTVD